MTGLVAAVALASPALAAAESTASEEGGAVLEPIATSPAAALAFWTQARREIAEPLPIVTVPDSSSDVESALSPSSEGAASPESVSTASFSRSSVARTAAIEGLETGSSTLYPNSANGKVYGVYEISGHFRLFECSGSVVSSPHGNVVLTAGHCVIEPESGAHALLVMFVPGYNSGVEPTGAEPYGSWPAIEYATTETWKATAKPGSHANEGGDLALLVLADNVEKSVGSLKIAFDEPCDQTYTQYGYPAEEPYGGNVLYSHTAAYAGPDTNPNFSPTPMKIASDFTKGASGGPWTIGPGSSPTVASLTAYGYESQPGYLYGPYFGEVARKTYERASGKSVPVGIEEVCKPLEAPKHTESTPTPSPAPASPGEAATAAPSVELRVTRVRHRANGSAVLIAKVSAAGKLKLTGTAVRAETVNAQNAGKYRLIVATKGRTGMRLRRKGRAKVGVKVAFSASGKTRRVSRLIRLTRRQAGRPTSPPARRSD